MSTACSWPELRSVVLPSPTPKPSTPIPTPSALRTKSSSPTITRTVLGLTRVTALDTRVPSS